MRTFPLNPLLYILYKMIVSYFCMYKMPFFSTTKFAPRAPFRRWMVRLVDPNPTLEAKSEWQLPLLPQLPSVFKETPSPLCDYSLRMVYRVSILIKSTVLSLFLAFITLSDLYYPHHPPSEGCTFRSQKKGI